ncbi:Hypothetical predicted protein [Olea europaea subsp. europaea]|uniref:Uncharacterized protein n=1 Tax=Olea europaea subsp. europaea TaxID=158383 RepID=A0A8S0PAE9_OLEEU|nr:Hypothetical predicted protein [Olea europaea subsp. europaea]
MGVNGMQAQSWGEANEACSSGLRLSFGPTSCSFWASSLGLVDLPPFSPHGQHVGEISQSHFHFDLKFERIVLAEAVKENPNRSRLGLETVPPKPTDSTSYSKNNQPPGVVPDCLPKRPLATQVGTLFVVADAFLNGVALSDRAHLVLKIFSQEIILSLVQAIGVVFLKKAKRKCPQQQIGTYQLKVIRVSFLHTVRPNLTCRIPKDAIKLFNFGETNRKIPGVLARFEEILGQNSGKISF